MTGLEALAASGGDVARIASVASFFVSRIDTIADAKLDEVGGHGRARAAGQGRDREREARLPALQGKHRQRPLEGARGAGRRRRSGCCGRARARRTPGTATLMYVEELIGPRHRRHRAPGDVRGLPPARPSAREPRGGRRGGAGHARRARRARDLARGDHRQADRGRRGSLRPGSSRSCSPRSPQSWRDPPQMRLPSARACRPRSRPRSATRSTTGSQGPR